MREFEYMPPEELMGIARKTPPLGHLHVYLATFPFSRQQNIFFCSCRPERKTVTEILYVSIETEEDLFPM